MSKLPVHLVRGSVDLIANKTLTAADQGTVQNVMVDGVVVTLPSTAAGLTFVVRNGGAKISAAGPSGATADGSVGFTVAPAAADGVNGLGFTSAANKGVINTKATSKVGDEITLGGTGTTGTAAWNIKEAFGVYARVA